MNAVWVKSSLSFSNGNCVEVTELPGGAVGVRNSRDPEGRVLRFTRGERDALLAGALTFAGVIMFQSRGRDLGDAVQPGVTWYDVLGVLPGAEVHKIKRKYEGKAALLRPELVSGASPDVVTAVGRARELLDTAWAVLGNPQHRKRYDEAFGLRHSGGGLARSETGIGWLERPRDRREIVPDCCGLFYQVCLELAIRHGLRVRTVRLTERPMAVDGLVVEQYPGPLAKARPGGTLTVQVWHPPAQPVRFRRAGGVMTVMG